MDDYAGNRKADWKTKVYVYHKPLVGFSGTINRLLQAVADEGGRIFDITTQFTPEKDWASCIVTYELPNRDAIKQGEGQGEAVPDEDSVEPIGFPTSPQRKSAR